jgi:G:T/U-mismatch repair DNA glycosylase
MSTSKLHISDDLSLPTDAITQTFAILAKRGVGKTHAGSVMAEEMLKLGQPIVVYDPTGAWYGLKSSKDGKRPGFPVVIFGGEHADVPLEETAGATVAQAIVEQAHPGDPRLRTDAQGRPHPLHDRLLRDALPQEPRGAALLRRRGADHRAAAQGHARGRPAARRDGGHRPARAGGAGSADDHLSAAGGGEHEPAVGLRGDRRHADRRAARPQGVSEWVDAHGDDESKAQGDDGQPLVAQARRGVGVVAELAGHVQADHVPRPRDVRFERHPRRRPADRRPKVVAEVDLDALGEQIRATVEKAKADDPKELRKTIQQLRAELTKAQQAKPAPAPAAKEKRVEIPVLKDGQLARLEKLAERLDKSLVSCDARIESVQKASESLRKSMEAPWHQANKTRDDLREGIAKLRGAIATAKGQTTQPAMSPARPLAREIMRNPIQPPPRRVSPPPTPARETNGDPSRKILHALAWWAAIGVAEPTTAQVGAVAGYAIGGTFSTYLGRLSMGGYIDRASGSIRLTDKGHIASPEVDAPMTLDELHSGNHRHAGRPQTTIIRALLAHGGEAITTEQLGQESGYAIGGTFSTYLGRLSSRGLIDRSRGMVSPTEVMYPPTLAVSV